MLSSSPKQSRRALLLCILLSALSLLLIHILIDFTKFIKTDQYGLSVLWSWFASLDWFPSVSLLRLLIIIS